MKIEAIVLAAGLSSRAGTNKLILEINSTTIIESCILSMYDHCSRIILVGGHYLDQIYRHTKKYPKVDLIYNQNYSDGMFSSVKTGLNFLQGDRFFLIPGDYPRVASSTYKEMLKIEDPIVIPAYKGKKGHPVLIDSNLADEISNDSSLNSLRDYIEKKRSTSLELVDPGILLDIDTLEDYENLKGF